MANNPYVNKVELANGTTLIDLSADTVTADTILEGYTAHDASGAPITGTARGGGIVITDTLDSHGGTIREITALEVVRLQSKSATPSQSAQTISPDTGYTGLSEVNVGAIPGEYVIPTGTKSISTNGTHDVSAYASASVDVEPTLQSKSATPTESAQTIEPDNGYDGLSSVSVGAISSSYVGSGITRRSSSDLTASGATVSVPAGYYSSAASKSVSSGSATAPATISGSSATVSTGTNTLTLSKTVSVTPVVSAGYVSSGTAGNSAVSLSASVTTKAAATYNTSSSDQTIASGTYLTGTQTIKAVTYSGLSAGNIADGVTVKIGDANDDDRIASVTGTLAFQTIYSGTGAPSSATGVNGDVYIRTA